MTAAVGQPSLPGLAFDTIAESYDSLFTASMVGRAQRAVVWQKAAVVFRAGNHVLELNCGTGEDAFFLAQRGISVTCCDASAGMIERAQSRHISEAGQENVKFHVLPTERLKELPSGLFFDGIFSNFSGLNCVEDLTAVARELAARTHPGTPLLACVSTRFCIWEMLHYSLRFDMRNAFRRCRGCTRASLGQYSFPVYYPTLRSLLKSIQPQFRLRSVTGVGVAVPPSYMEGWAQEHPLLFRGCELIDKKLRGLCGFRVVGDHMLLHLERA